MSELGSEKCKQMQIDYPWNLTFTVLDQGMCDDS